ncbi:hypothetical protein C900_02452 [Fulvivirga imtechensis AK7]|uniref:Uncharacterized protein n=1 Tax=Fulvivirga imtechensis AK7 TaxID=1237149 RepID=L8JVK3_9BACT|nr:hypothetical protein [Fulvivirga imtechensis]ELR71644.1 hypothetical protein C900_02452 [Fulvivirga imtechensis AK7]
MRHNRTTIARILLISYFLVAVGTAGAQSLLPSLFSNIGCKKLLLTEKSTTGPVFQVNNTLDEEHEMPELPFSDNLSFCGSLSVCIKPAFTFPPTSHFTGDRNYCSFKVSIYNPPFQNREPDPPRHTFC